MPAVIAAFVGSLLSVDFILMLSRRLRGMAVLLVAGIMIGYIRSWQHRSDSGAVRCPYPGCDRLIMYEELISWADLYDHATFEAKKMIVNCMIRRVEVFRDYKLNVEFNFNLNQFLNGLDISA